MPTKSSRLPESVTPERYRIELRPDLEKFRFQGEESIAIRVLEPVKAILLNASELEVTSATLQRSGESPRAATSIDHQKEDETVRLIFGSSVPKGPATLRLVFSGVLNDELAGFYRSRYTMSDGTEGFMAATQFESTD
ncbi:MAG TPA: hypothetical protein VFA17_08900, partial [Thermoplasmata archaeon]|nr:hypothetical protein [Thermoplasmata archaeon]